MNLSFTQQLANSHLRLFNTSSDKIFTQYAGAGSLRDNRCSALLVTESPTDLFQPFSSNVRATLQETRVRRTLVESDTGDLARNH